MLNNDLMTAAAGAIRDQVLALMRDHENEKHAGLPCYGNRASFVAYIAHCLGVRGDLWRYAHDRLQEYDEDCQDNTCPHTEEAHDSAE